MSGSYGARRTGRALSLLRKQKIGTRRAAGPFADRIGTLRDERSRCPSPDVRPRLKRGRSCGRAMPKFEHEKAVRFEMSPEAAEGLQRVSFRQQISEGPEHAHGRVERSAESKRAHVGADEPGSHA